MSATMATFSDDGGSVDFHGQGIMASESDPLASTGSMRHYLQTLLDQKEKQLQQAGALGQSLLQQRVDLEEQVRQLQDVDLDKREEEDVSAEMRLRYRDLVNMLKKFEGENVQLTSTFGNKQVNGYQPSPTIPLSDLPTDASSSIPSAPSASQSRRAKNAAHRADDVEFAFEIGSSLLTEVRRLQSLLGERDKAIQDMKEEKDDLEKAVESLRTALRTQEQNADKFKEENWNLEVTLQELRTQLSEAQSAAQRGETETKRLTKLLARSSESNDTYKNEVERLKTTMEEKQAKHETDLALNRKHVAALARDKQDLQHTIDNYKMELQRASRRLPRYGSPATPDSRTDTHLRVNDDEDDDPFGGPSAAASMNRRRLDTSALFPPDAFGPDSVDNSPDPSPSRPFIAPNHPSNEIEALQQKLGHAHKQILTLKGSLSREQKLRIGYRRQLFEAGLTKEEKLDDEDDAEGDGNEEEAVEEVGQTKTRTKATPFRSRGRGRGIVARSGGLSGIANRLINAQSPTSELGDDDTSPMGDPDAYPNTYLPEMQIPEDASGMQNDSDIIPPQSPDTAAPSNRTSIVSVEGMDPMFANVLKRSNSNASVNQDSSPVFRGSVRGRGGTIGRRRGGMAYQHTRPSSIVDAPEVLADQFAGAGVGMESVMEDEVAESLPREMKDFECQTEFVEPPVQPAPAPVITFTPEKADIGIQSEPEPVPVLPEAPAVLRTDATMQTDESPHAEIAISTDAEVVPTKNDGSTMTETHILVPTSEMQVQTSRMQTLDVEVQTSHEETEIQTMPDGDVVQEATMRPETPLRNLTEAETQTTPRAETFSANITPRSSSIGGLGYARLRYLSSASTVTGLPRTSMHQIIQDIDDNDNDDNRTELAYATDTDPEEETDMDDYQDARSALVPTPGPSASDSVNDFHSMSTMTDNDYSSDEGDVESIKASVMHAGGRRSRASSTMHTDESAGPSHPTVTYDEQQVATDPLPEEPKRQLSETSIQTDDWQPVQPVSPVPLSPQGFGLYRVGPNSQQFQFVSPPTSAPATTTVTPVAIASPASSTASQRDSQATIGARPIRFSSPSLPGDVDRRKSIDSTLSANEFGQRQHTQSLGPTMSPTIDKTRPPTMMLPPPPKLPPPSKAPPPPGSMPPPSFIPEKRRPASSLSSHRDMPPPRPSSPPPPELIQRATTPTYGSVLTVPGNRMGSMRQHGSSLPPMASLRQPPSTLSFRSAANAAAHANGLGSSVMLDNRDRHLRSATSLLSDQEDIASRRSSVSSDFHPRIHSEPEHPGNQTHGHGVQSTPNKSANLSGSTDPAIIHAITQTMIGEFLYKYTRRTIGKGHGERRHKRFFWVHPYTRTLYWSSADPGSTNVTEQSAKSAYIDSVRAVLDPNPMPPGLHQYSVIISTPQREMKLTAPTKERHEIWLNALQYLLVRPTPSVQSPGQVNGTPATPMRLGQSQRGGVVSPMSQRSARSEQSGISGETAWNITPRNGRRSRSRVSVGGSVGKRSGTPAAEYLRWTDGPGSPGAQSLHGFEHVGPGLDADDDELDFEIHDSMTSDQEGFEGLENVRACCDGRHTVGRSGHIHEHHHHHHHHPGHPPQFLRQESAAAEHLQPSRPVSPAFSFRSRASSTKSRDGGGGTGSLFSRFGTRRSKQAPLSTEQ